MVRSKGVVAFWDLTETGSGSCGFELETLVGELCKLRSLDGRWECYVEEQEK